MAIPFSDEDYRVLETYLKNTLTLVASGLKSERDAYNDLAQIMMAAIKDNPNLVNEIKARTDA